MRADHRRFQQHVDEEIVDAVRAQFQIDREINRTYASIGDRPIFTVPLSDEEQWLHWQDPALREQTIKDIEQREGPAAVPKYVTHMATIARRLGRKGRAAPVATADRTPALPQPPEY